MRSMLFYACMPATMARRAHCTFVRMLDFQRSEIIQLVDGRLSRRHEEGIESFGYTSTPPTPLRPMSFRCYDSACSASGPWPLPPLLSIHQRIRSSGTAPIPSSTDLTKALGRSVERCHAEGSRECDWKDAYVPLKRPAYVLR